MWTLPGPLWNWHSYMKTFQSLCDWLVSSSHTVKEKGKDFGLFSLCLSITDDFAASTDPFLMKHCGSVFWILTWLVHHGATNRPSFKLPSSNVSDMVHDLNIQKLQTEWLAPILGVFLLELRVFCILKQGLLRNPPVFDFSHYSLYPCKSYVPHAAEKHSHNIMLPPPYFTVGMMLYGSRVVSFLPGLVHCIMSEGFSFRFHQTTDWSVTDCSCPMLWVYHMPISKLQECYYMPSFSPEASFWPLLYNPDL